MSCSLNRVLRLNEDSDGFKAALSKRFKIKSNSTKRLHDREGKVNRKCRHGGMRSKKQGNWITCIRLRDEEERRRFVCDCNKDIKQEEFAPTLYLHFVYDDDDNNDNFFICPRLKEQFFLSTEKKKIFSFAFDGLTKKKWKQLGVERENWL